MENHSLDVLRLKAEQIAVFNHKLSRRPTCAPRLQPTDEMTALLRELKWLNAEDKSVVRLWAIFTDPRRGRVQCRGFQLCAGVKHDRKKKIWSAQYHDKQAVTSWLQQRIEQTSYSDVQDKYQHALQCTEAKHGGWSFGPQWGPCRNAYSPELQRWNNERLPKYLRLRELANQLVADLCDAPEKQIQAAGRFYGHCCICGRALTDPISLEYGIGPECRGRLRGFGVEVQNLPGQWIIGGTNAENESCETFKP
jgi:hypothetical protein